MGISHIIGNLAYLKRGLVRILQSHTRISICVTITTATVVGGLLSYGTAQAQTSGQALDFEIPSSTLANNLINKLWLDDPEYQWWVKDNGAVPTYESALADINGDKTPEIFASHADPYLGYCEEPVAPNRIQMCRLHIYAYTSKGLVELARFMSGPRVVVQPSRTNNVNDLSIEQADGSRLTYVWNGKTYEAKKPQ